MLLTVRDRNFRTHITKQKDANNCLLPCAGFAVKSNTFGGEELPHADRDRHGRNGIRAAARASLAESDQRIVIQMEDPRSRITELLDAHPIPWGARRFIISDMSAVAEYSQSPRTSFGLWARF
jgi:hypothetical protein